MDSWEEKTIEMVRRGQGDRVEYLEKLAKHILPTHLERVQKNDKTVLKEMVLPQWMDWEILREWSLAKKPEGTTRECALCNTENEAGIDFEDKFVCEYCFLKLKNLE
ncbi:MAG: hypothetical protein NUV67_05475 [archaeon]|nr:hypothetical protein [archaeon]